MTTARTPLSPQAFATRQSVQCTSRSAGRKHACAAPAALPVTQDDVGGLDLQMLSDLMVADRTDPDDRPKFDALAAALGVPLSTVKGLVYKKRGLLNMEPQEVKDKITQLADILKVTPAQAREMVLIQPGLLFETDKQGNALDMGIKLICYELKAEREEVVGLIIKNPSVLHGREMHLSAADIASLAMKRQPNMRVID